MTVWDNPKTVVVSRKRELIVWNSIFGQVALDYRFAPELCWPRSGNQKGAVENLVGWVKGSFFTCRRFHDRADLDAQLAQWLTEVNTRRPSRATGIIPSVRLEQERLRLRPLPLSPAAYALKIPVVVSARARVAYEGMTYSMPPDTIGQPATLHLYRDRVELVTKAGLSVRHPRVPSGATSILPEHRTAMLGAVRGVRARLYYQRQSLWELGPAAEAWLDGVGASTAHPVARGRGALLHAPAGARARGSPGGLHRRRPAARHRGRIRRRTASWPGRRARRAP
jgi:hypothetical protein